MEKESNLSLLLTGFLSLVLGIVLIIATEELLVSVNYVLVCIFAIIGVIQIISFLVNKHYQNNNYNSLVLGTIFIWLALFIYVYYTMIIIILPIILSLFTFIMGLILIVKYINTKNKTYIILSIVSFILGIILIFKPILTIYTYFKLAGIYIILIGLSYFIEYIKTIKNK